MFLALIEMRRAKVRFGLLIGAVALLAFLILFQNTLEHGLITAYVGGIRHQSAAVLVYDIDGRRNLQSSVISNELERTIASVEGVARAGRIGKRTFGALADGRAQAATVIGYEHEGLGSPTTLVRGRLPTVAGEGVASEADAADGFDIGNSVFVEPGDYEIKVVGQVRDASLSASPTLFTTYETYEKAVVAVDLNAVPHPSVIGLEAAPGVTNAELVARVNAASDELDALSRADAERYAPGVSAIRSSFLIVLVLYGLVVPFLIALFFLIVTFQKARSLTLLTAMGAPTRRLVWSLMIQVATVLGLGVGLGTLIYTPLSSRRIGRIPMRFETAGVVSWATGLVALGLVSAVFAAVRLRRIDPMGATLGTGAGA